MRGPEVRASRREAAEARQVARDMRLPEEQLARLEAGGHGGCQEAQRLREIVYANRAAS